MPGLHRLAHRTWLNCAGFAGQSGGGLPPFAGGEGVLPSWQFRHHADVPTVQQRHM